MIAETPQELEQLLVPIAAAGVDLFDCSQRRFWEPSFAGSDLNLAGWARKITGKPSMSVGSVTLGGEFEPKKANGSALATGLGLQVGAGAARNLDRVAAMMERGDFDLIAVGRALLANWNWPILVREGRLDDLVPFGPDTLARATLFPERGEQTTSKHSERGA
jgi:2,4-dienoyl-CoA reductase-like NADH-dependent reductase (Old Yellow Enzyme family)